MRAKNAKAGVAQCAPPPVAARARSARLFWHQTYPGAIGGLERSKLLEVCQEGSRSLVVAFDPEQRLVQLRPRVQHPMRDHGLDGTRVGDALERVPLQQQHVGWRADSQCAQLGPRREELPGRRSCAHQSFVLREARFDQDLQLTVHRETR